MGEVLRSLKSLDAFPKIQDDFYSKTLSGGVITIVCCTIMGALFLSELGADMPGCQSISHASTTMRRRLMRPCC